MKIIITSFALCLALIGAGIAADAPKIKQGKNPPSTTTNPTVDPASPAAPRVLPSPSRSGTTRMTGTVESLDRSGNRVRIRDDKGRVTDYQVREDTTFMSEGRKSRLSDVNVGDPVTFESDPDQRLIQFDFGRPAR